MMMAGDDGDGDDDDDDNDDNDEQNEHDWVGMGQRFPDEADYYTSGVFLAV
jgi:hypothetical protein